MANRPLRPCKRTGCTALTREGWCEQHKPDWRERERKASAAWHWMYNTKWWKRTRQMVLLEDPWCYECAAHGQRVRATEVDHRTPHRGVRTLFFDRTNLGGLCHACHSRKTMREQNEARMLVNATLPPP